MLSAHAADIFPLLPNFAALLRIACRLARALRRSFARLAPVAVLALPRRTPALASFLVMVGRNFGWIVSPGQSAAAVSWPSAHCAPSMPAMGGLLHRPALH